MVVMTCLYVALRRSRTRAAQVTDSRTPLLRVPEDDQAPGSEGLPRPSRSSLFDIVPLDNIDLFKDEHQEDEEDLGDDAERVTNLQGKWSFAWRLWYQLA